MNKFDTLCEKWMLDEETETKEKYPWKISEEDKILLGDKVCI